MKITGKALIMGDNVNTDVLHPSRFFSLDDRTVRSGFLQAAAGYEQIGGTDLAGRVIVAGENFGCGSSRETGAKAFVLAGIRAVVARSLARIFSRNVRNLGLPAIECPTLPALAPDTEVELDLERGLLLVPASSLELPISPLDPFWAQVLRAGGLLPFLGLAEPADGPAKSGATLPLYQGHGHGHGHGRGDA
jgi:3-isopropylmalate/(R)-2-methylmalate dehydratase small subunit